jgi:mannose-6-phosphate isomerase-like protein (cupin superfamily)
MLEKAFYQSLRTEFIRKIKPILEELERYNEEERYYLRWYELRNDIKALLEFAEAYGEEEITKRYLIHPRTFFQSGNDFQGNLLEDAIFNRGKNFKDRNIILMKHNRYSPVFEHSHSYFETFLVLSGSCTNTIGGKRFLMTAGQLCFIAPNTLHSLAVFDDSIVINIIIRKSTFDEIFFNLLTSGDILARFF